MAVGVVDDRLLFVVSESLADLTVPNAGGRGDIGRCTSRSTWVRYYFRGTLICQIFFIEYWCTASWQGLVRGYKCESVLGVVSGLAAINEREIKKGENLEHECGMHLESRAETYGSMQKELRWKKAIRQSSVVEMMERQSNQLVYALGM